ncbi:hypothetical protein POTOM_030847 [Populus tomentosa]|uniref:Ankyrin repeat family protein n=1 Tax=Populus tomentosa TaxID=118781 RepID=A0A8X8CRC7_POPTO|nr:hypothetical protein POTOM_030847 [Populus tomentosa]
MTTTNISPSSIVVEVLRDDNYDDWSACMKSYMLAQDLWDFIEPSTGHHEGDQAVDSKPIDHQEGDSKALRKRNAAALDAIQISCAPYILSKIRSIASAKDAWDTLANLQPQHSPSHTEQSDEAEPSEDDESQGSYAHNGDWDAIKTYLSHYPNATKAKLEPYGGTALHVAASTGHLRVVEELVKLMSVEELEIQDNQGRTALFIAVVVGIRKMAECLVQSENSSFSTNVTLTESNYDVWSQIMEMQIAGREKLEYLVSNTIPEKTDPSYAKWYAENQKIKGWLLTSMSPEIMKRYLRLPTAHEIWNALAKAFYDGADESQLFTLNQRAFSTKQVGRPISTYYGDLVEIFQELDHRDKIVMKDPDDVIAYKKSVERLRVHIFLNGLDEEFEQIRGEILRRDSALDLEETYAYVRRDSIRRNTLNGEPGHLEPSAIIARRSNYEIGAARPERICTHCGETGHTKLRCYELIGYPEWWDFSKAPRKRNLKANPHVSIAVAEPNHMFGNKYGKDSSSGAITGNARDTAENTGADAVNAGKALHTSTSVRNSEWIIDSGATNHMTFNNNIQTIQPSNHHVVFTANGTPFSVSGEGTVTLKKNLSLESVLIVPNLNHNLLSVAQITCALMCVVIFWPNLCIFKDIQTWKTIGYGTRRGKLYYLDLIPASSNQLAQVFSTNTANEHQKSEIWLWHRRLGHASFGYLQKLFPQLFSQLIVSDFKCDVCERAKSHRVSFPISLRTKLEPRGLRCVFVGYALHQKGYRCYHPPSRQLYVTLDVVFHETTMYYSSQTKENDEVQIATKPTDNVDIIAHGNQLIDTLDSLETNEECPVNENTEEHQDMEEYTSENGPEIIDANQDTLEGPTASHSVPVNQLSSPVDSRLESHDIHPVESLKELPNRVTRVKIKQLNPFENSAYVFYFTFVNAQKRIPLAQACRRNCKDMALYLYSVTPFEFLCQGNGHHGSFFLQCAIGAQMLDIALDFLHRCPRSATTMDEVTKKNGLIYLSEMPEIFPSASRLAFWQQWIYSCIPMQSIAIADDNVRINMPDQSLSESKNIILQVLSKLRGFAINLLSFLGIKQIYDLKKIHIYSDKILRCTCEHISTLDYEEYDKAGVHGAFHNAVKNGMVEFIIEVIKANKERFVCLVDSSGNTMLHLVAKLSPPSQLARISGAALQMQRELQWYKEVESIMYPTYKVIRNKKNQTAEELFTSEHKDLLVKGEEWMKQAATSCTVVGALIITIMFTVAFTVPGGNVQETGYPVFKDEKSFTVFIVADAISLFSSSTSVLMFLGILTSRYAEEDFLKSLPKKLIIGLSMLFFSIAAMMVTFCAALIIMLDGRLQVIIPIVLLASIPVTLFMLLQFPLLVEIFVSTYGPGIFNRKMKRWY